jgi:hypothetical protein
VERVGGGVVESGRREGVCVTCKFHTIFVICVLYVLTVLKTKGHSAKRRPAQVSAWVQRARISSLEIKDVRKFAEEWAVWWQDINPAWCKISLPMPKQDGVWDNMDLPGPNGFLNVLICLKWWRGKLEEESKEWLDAVEDVMWVLKQMNG